MVLRGSGTVLYGEGAAGADNAENVEHSYAGVLLDPA